MRLEREAGISCRSIKDSGFGPKINGRCSMSLKQRYDMTYLGSRKTSQGTVSRMD